MISFDKTLINSFVWNLKSVSWDGIRASNFILTKGWFNHFVEKKLLMKNQNIKQISKKLNLTFQFVLSSLTTSGTPLKFGGRGYHRYNQQSDRDLLGRIYVQVSEIHSVLIRWLHHNSNSVKKFNKLQCGLFDLLTEYIPFC